MFGARLKLRVPGKLMVAGEYAVLEPHQEAVVVAMNRYVQVTISVFDDNRLFLPGLGLRNIGWVCIGDEIQFSLQDVRLRYIERALAIALAYIKSDQIELQPFSLTIESELDDPDGRKYGLGSSAAVVVAVVSAVLSLFGVDTSEHDLIFKLSAIAHYQAQGSGSGADVAASTFGGWLRYTSFDSEWLSARLANCGHLRELVDGVWPSFRAERLHPPSELYLCVGWTGEPAATAPLISQVRNMKSSNLEGYERFLADSAEAVKNLVQAFQICNVTLAVEAFVRNRIALATLGGQAGVPIETPLLRELHTIARSFGGAGKPSGAGGGDCGIALMIGSNSIEQLYRAWRQVGIEPLDICVSHSGVHVVETL